MGVCCAKEDKQESEKTQLLSNDAASLDDKIIISPDTECKTQESVATSPPIEVYKAAKGNIITIPSVEDNHIHKKIHASIFINYWFRNTSLNNNNKTDVIPDSVIDIISNYVIKQNITCIIYIDKGLNDDLYFNMNTNNNSITLIDTDNDFIFDGIYYNDNHRMFNDELQCLCTDFINGYNTSCILFGDTSISKDIFYKDFINKTGLLHNCIAYILSNLRNCCLFIKIYGITINNDDKEEYIDLLRIASNVTITNQFESKMLLNMESFHHLMQQYSIYLKQYKMKSGNNNIIILFELTLQTILNEDGISNTFSNILDPMNNINNILNPMELKISTMQFVDIGNVNPINLIENTPNTKLFKQLSQKIKIKNQSLFNLYDIIKYIGDENNNNDLDKDKVMEMCKNALLTDKICESLGGNCKAMILGICSNQKSEEQNTMSILKILQTAMKVNNNPCINMFYPL